MLMPTLMLMLARHLTHRPPPRAPTPPEVIEAREREKELKELDRDTRTVFAYNLNLKADERDLFEFFSQAGEVRSNSSPDSNASWTDAASRPAEPCLCTTAMCVCPPVSHP